MTAQIPDSSPRSSALRQRPADLEQENIRLGQENARLFEELERRDHDLTEAVEQQTATAEVLRAIASAPTSLDTVLGTLVASAARLTNADEAVILRIDGSTLPVVASTSGHPALSANAVMPLDERSVSGHAIRERRAIVADTFRIEIIGQGGHAARPHLCVDTVLVAAQVVTALHTLVAREVNPSFDLDESALSLGVKMFVRVVERYLAE
ncbi:MAG: hypothetical protein H0V51_12505 [Chloroflexi bacterium]|nr:hypothetical protein [Chloroflexota bacterium]